MSNDSSIIVLNQNQNTKAMTNQDLQKKTKHFVYKTIMAFKDFGDSTNKALIDEIVQSATRMSAYCRNTCEDNLNEVAPSALNQCGDFLGEIIYLLNLLDNTKTMQHIKTENLIIDALDLKQTVLKICGQK